MLVSSLGVRNLGTVGLGVLYNSWVPLWGLVCEKMCSPIFFFSVDFELPLSLVIPLLPIWLAINSNPFVICWDMTTIFWFIYSNKGLIIWIYSIFSLVWSSPSWAIVLVQGTLFFPILLLQAEHLPIHIIRMMVY